MLYRDYLKNKRDYQERGHLFLLDRKHACLYYKPGKGKTYPCIDALRDVDASKKGNAKVLILSTANAIKNMWEAEIVPQKILPKNTVLMSLNSAIVDKTKNELMKIKWDVIVIDECHKIKSHNSKSSKLVYQLSKKTEFCWGLSGTPRGNSDVDIFCQFHNMNISDWGNISYTQFVESCCDIDQKFFRGCCVKIPVGINRRYKAGWERNIAMYTQRIEYDDDDNMPELNVNLIELEYEYTKEYKNAMDGVIQLSDYENTMTKLVAIQKLHQIVNGFVYYTDEDGIKKVYEISDNIKLNWLKENAQKNNVIVYRFDWDRQKITEALSKKFTITEIVEDFKSGDADILLLQCSKCESFNLQMCNRIIFYTLDYSYINYNQMIHRVWRIGQNEQVDITILTFKGTVESDIWDSVKNKENMADLFMRVKGV